MGEEPGTAAELGVGLTDSFAAKRRLDGRDGLRKQQGWARGYLAERALAAFLGVSSLAAFLMLLAVEEPLWIRAPVIALPLAIAIALAGIRLVQRSVVTEARARQLAAHRAATRNDG